LATTPCLGYDIVDARLNRPSFCKGSMMPDLMNRITVDPEVCGGRPCIRGYRLRVKDVLELLAAGAPREKILSDYAFLEDDDITAALTFAARANDHPIIRAAE
jgi:uncharacterized protein (DUF433 family)